MKTLQVFGWAVIFTVTLLLSAFASHTPEVADTDAMSGPELTMTQTESQKQMIERHENALVILDAGLNEHETRLAQVVPDLTRQEEIYTFNQQAWLNERETRFAQVVPDLTRQEEIYTFNQQAWLNEREDRLAQDVPDLTRQEEIYTFNQQAWLNEREDRLAQDVPDLTRQEEIYTFNQLAWLNEREMLVEEMEKRTTSAVKLAGVDFTPVAISPTPIKVEAGRCYARVVYPAEYKTVAVIKPIEVPKEENLPTLYQSVTEKVKVTDEQTRWEEILCEDRMTDCRVMEVQRALYRGGYKPGPIDGVVGRQTMAAINNFQKDFNLTVTDQLTIETVNALDANF